MGATPQVIENLLANFLTRYRRRHPDVEVHLIEDGGVRLNSRLERGDVHLVLTAANGRIDNSLLYPMHALAALSPTHPRARQAVLEVADLADEPLLLLRRDFGSREWFVAACSIAYCWRAPPGTRSSLWRQQATGSRSFHRMHKSPAALFAQCHSSTAGHRLGGGR